MEQFIKENMCAMIDDLTDLVAKQSVYDGEDKTHPPFGAGVEDALQTVLKLGKSFGMTVKNYDGYAGEITAGNGAHMIGVLCHVDVVPAGEGWETKPFVLTEQNGRLYGRGSSDDKGPLVSCLYAMKYLLDAGKIPADACIRMIIGANEEESWQCIRHYLEQAETLPALSFVPDGSFPLISCEKGLLDFDLCSADIPDHHAPVRLVSLEGGTSRNIVPSSASCCLECKDAQTVAAQLSDLPGIAVQAEGHQVTVTAKGKSAHCMSPEKGVNAIAHLLHALAQLGKDFSHSAFAASFDRLIGKDYTGERFGIAMQDDVSGALTFNIGTIRLTADGVFSMQANIRYPASACYETVQESVRSCADRAGLQYTEVDHLPPVYFEKGSPLVRALLETYQEVTGDTTHEPFSIGGATYARALPNAVAFGPQFPYEEELAHEPNEFLAIDSLEKMTAIYGRALEKLLAL